jgi:hypothetical protein
MSVGLSHTADFPGPDNCFALPRLPWTGTCASGAVVPLQNKLTTHLRSM